MASYVIKDTLLGDVTLGEQEKTGYGENSFWRKTVSDADLGIKINNSLLKDRLTPLVPAIGKTFTWYTCGPTVYDSCHMGHARTYLTLDILRRIVQDYFHYNVVYHINITDIDDKIILRARRNKLVEDFVRDTELTVGLTKIQDSLKLKGEKLQKKTEELQQSTPPTNHQELINERETKIKEQTLKNNQHNHNLNVVLDIKKILDHTKGEDKNVHSIISEILKTLKTNEKFANLLDINVPENVPFKEAGTIVGALLEKVLSQENIIEILEDPSNPLFSSTEELIERLKFIKLGSEQGLLRAAATAAFDSLSESLDAEKGHLVTDHDVFNSHSRKYEKEFLEDMEALGIRPPDALTRVTEYVSKIIDFVKGIVDKGIAYESNGSVYLDINEYKKQNHIYRKLVPGEDTSKEMMEESEGALGNQLGKEKKHPNDFALWKASKQGEPFWASPWGNGRPGWHIECSVIASDILGPNIDVHAGGWDLKFPHNDNELAQSEAFFGHDQWINYFIHTGHLHIKGLKMSKSLKNFITIRQALKHHTARQLRLLFLYQNWDKPMNYSDEMMKFVKSREREIKAFFNLTKEKLRSNWLNGPVGWLNHATDKGINILLHNTIESVDAALKHNFNTPLAMDNLAKLTKQCVTDGAQLSPLTLRQVANYVAKMFKIFGVIRTDDISFSGDGDKDESQNYEETITPFATTLVNFRKQIRDYGLATKNGEILKHCDVLRDEQLPHLGLRLTDGVDGSHFEFEDKNILLKEIEDRKRELKLKEKQRLENKIKDLRNSLKKAEENEFPPNQRYTKDPKYEGFQFDGDGIPIKDKSGADVDPKEQKKLSTNNKKYEKTFNSVLKIAEKKNESISQMIASLKAQLSQLESDLKSLD